MPWGPVGARSSACTALSPPSSWCCNEYLLRVPVQTGPLGCTLSLHGGWRPLPQAASGRTVAISQDEGRACGKPPVQGRHEEVPLCPACHRPSSHCVLKATPPPGTRSPGAACDHCAVVSSSSHQCGTPVGICTCPWAPSLGPPGLFFSGKRFGKARELSRPWDGWLRRGRLAWALSGALGACSLPPVSRRGAGPGGSQLAHVTGLWWGRTRTFCRSPRLLGFCGPLPSSQPPGPRGPGHLTRDRLLYSASSVPGLWKVGSQFQDPARCVAPGHGSLGRHSTSRGKASPSPAQRHALPCKAISILRGAGLKLVSESWEQRGFSPENVSVTLCGL